LTQCIKKECPDAWLLNVSNPLPRVIESASLFGVKSVGFCSVAQSVYPKIATIFDITPTDFPYNKERSLWNINTAGVNHLAWLLELTDKETGEDLYPKLRQKISDGKTSHNPLAESVLRETGYLLTAGDDHIQDFVTPLDENHKFHTPWHGNVSERANRIELLNRVGKGESKFHELLEQVAWEKPGQFIASFTGAAKPTSLVLNLVNDQNQISNLPSHCVVETNVMVEQNVLKAEKVTLPSEVLPITSRTAKVTELIVKASQSKSLSKVHDAIELDPTVLDKSKGIAAIDACIIAHSDLIGNFA
jgi:alpha-galactosidase